MMRGELEARILLPSKTSSKKTAAKSSQRVSKGRGAANKTKLDPKEHDLFEALRAYRLQRSRKDGVPPYHVASDRTLREIAQLKPTSLDVLQLAHGIGPAKLDRYGEELLEVVQQS